MRQMVRTKHSLWHKEIYNPMWCGVHDLVPGGL